jgi:hypothetical protein
VKISKMAEANNPAIATLLIQAIADRRRHLIDATVTGHPKTKS